MRERERFTNRFCPPHANLDRNGVTFQEVLDELADYEDFMDKWALRDLDDLDRILRGVNAVGGLDHMADLAKAEKEGRLSIKEKCCICGNIIEGYGNNAEPFADGICCDICNHNFVLPKRLLQITNAKLCDEQ